MISGVVLSSLQTTQSNMRTMFCEQLLGMQKCTPNNRVLLEVGRRPLVLLAEKAAVNNWERILIGRTNYFMKMSFIGAQIDLDWLTKIKICIAQTDIDNSFLNVGKSPDKHLHHYFKSSSALSEQS